MCIHIYIYIYIYVHVSRGGASQRPPLYGALPNAGRSNLQLHYIYIYIYRERERYTYIILYIHCMNLYLFSDLSDCLGVAQVSAAAAASVHSAAWGERRSVLANIK